MFIRLPQNYDHMNIGNNSPNTLTTTSIKHRDDPLAVCSEDFCSVSGTPYCGCQGVQRMNVSSNSIPIFKLFYPMFWIFDDFWFKSVQVISPVPRIFETKSLMVVQDVVHRVAPQHRLFHHGRVGLRGDLLGAHLDIFTASGAAAQQHGSCEWSPIFWWHQDVEPLWKDMEMVLPCCAKRVLCLTILRLEMEFAWVGCARFGASSSHSKISVFRVGSFELL